MAAAHFSQSTSSTSKCRIGAISEASVAASLHSFAIASLLSLFRSPRRALPASARIRFNLEEFKGIADRAAKAAKAYRPPGK